MNACCISVSISSSLMELLLPAKTHFKSFPSKLLSRSSMFRTTSVPPVVGPASGNIDDMAYLSSLVAFLLTELMSTMRLP